MRYIQFTQPSSCDCAPAGSGGRLAARRFEDEIDWLFGPALNALSGPAAQFPVDLYEDKENTYVRAELPGVNRDAIGVEIVDGSLSIQATRTQKQGEAEKTVPLSRLIGIPGEVQTDKVAAAYENGVLTVTLPRREEAKPRKINVSVG
ncbi:MAG TPA: Hsp20/alpha crystallin family protein [Opitutaceae bacterium]|jgi:HSP20 family protein